MNIYADGVLTPDRTIRKFQIVTMSNNSNAGTGNTL